MLKLFTFNSADFKNSCLFNFNQEYCLIILLHISCKPENHLVNTILNLVAAVIYAEINLRIVLTAKHIGAIRRLEGNVLDIDALHAKTLLGGIRIWLDCGVLLNIIFCHG